MLSAPAPEHNLWQPGSVRKGRVDPHRRGQKRKSSPPHLVLKSLLDRAKGLVISQSMDRNSFAFLA